jgi:hypothetical protein
MAMLPFNCLGILLVKALVLNIVLEFAFEGVLKYGVLIAMLIGAWASNVMVGVWTLTVLNHPDVIAGFEYKPE